MPEALRFAFPRFPDDQEVRGRSVGFLSSTGLKPNGTMLWFSKRRPLDGVCRRRGRLTVTVGEFSAYVAGAVAEMGEELARNWLRARDFAFHFPLR